MTGRELRELRQRNGWTQKQIAELLNSSLERKYTNGTIGSWENEKRRVPAEVERLLAGLELERAFPLEPPPLDGETIEPDGGPDDSAPPPPPGSESRGQLPLPTGGDPRFARVCEELWEMVATGVGMVGAVTGSEALRRDGEIILADKQALGKAYGKLAETNATFRRMLTSMTSGGAWLEVALVSGVTAGKMMRSHQGLKEQQRRQRLEEQTRLAEEDGGGPVIAAVV